MTDLRSSSVSGAALRAISIVIVIGREWMDGSGREGRRKRNEVEFSRQQLMRELSPDAISIYKFDPTHTDA